MRRVGLVGRGVCVAVLLAWAAAGALGQGAGPAAGTPPSEADPRVQECARLRREAEEHQKAGRSMEAIAATEKVLALEEKVYGASDVRLLETLKSLDRLHFDRDDMGSARKAAQRALDIARRGRGEGHPEEREAYWRLDFVDRLSRLAPAKRQDIRAGQTRLLDRERQKAYRDVLSLGEKLRAAHEEVLGNRHPYYAHDLITLAKAHEALGEWAPAAGLRREAQKTYQATLGTLHPITLQNHDEYIGSLQEAASQAEGKEDFAGAARARAEIVDCQEGRHGKENWRVIDARLDLAHVRVLEKLTAPQRRQLAQAYQDMTQAVRMLSKGQSQQALPLLRRVTEEMQAMLGEKHPDYATALSNLAVVYRNLGDDKQALQMLLQARDLRREIQGEKHPDYATALNNLAVVYSALGDNKQALQVHLQVREVLKVVLGERHPGYAGTLTNLALAYSELGDYKQALKLHLQARDLLQDLGQEKHPDFASILNNVAETYRALGDNAQALKIHRQVRDLRKEIFGEKHPAYAITLNNLAGVYRALGDDKEALQLLLQVRDLRKEILGEKHPSYATALSNLAGVYSALGDNAQALQLVLQARDLRKEILGEKHPAYAATLNTLAGVYNELGDNAQALKIYLQARDLAKATLGEKHPDYAGTLSSLALAYSQLGDNVQALKFHLQVRELRKETLGAKHPDYATTLNNLAVAYSDLGDNAQGLQLHLQVRELRKEIQGEKHPAYATTLSNLAVVYSALGDNKQALALLIQARDLQKEILGEKHPAYAATLNNLAEVYHALGDTAQALKILLQVRELRKESQGEKHSDYGRTLNNLASVYRDLRDYSQAASLSRQAIELTRDTIERSATALSERQQLAHAQGLHAFLNNCLITSADARLTGPDAYAPVLAWRGAVTARQRLTRAARATVADPNTGRLFAQLEDVSRQLASLYGRAPDKPANANLPARIEALIDRRERLEAALAERTAAFRQLRAGRSLTPAQLQELLPPGVALVDFVDHGSDKEIRERATGLTAFVVRRERIQWVELRETKPIAEAVRKFRGALRRGRPAPGEDDPAMTLRRLVWQPLDEALYGANVVLLSPDGPLNDLPFAALPGREKGQYLLEEVALAVVPVPQMLPELLQVRGRDNLLPSLLVLGDIDYGAAPGTSTAVAAEALVSSGPRSRAERAGQRQQWARLPGMRMEALAVADAFRKAVPQGRLRELTGGDATEAAVRRLAPGHAYFHAATHGFFAPRDVPRATVRDAGRGLMGSGVEQVMGFHSGLLSGLVLAGANRPSDEGDDGVLTALEVSELDLSKLQLAVLSACETGLGEVAGGEGVLGLQRAFQVAGARSAVTSLWKVDDAATRALMTRFYENLWRHKKEPLEALREAQVWMLRGGSGGSGKSAGDRGLGGRAEGEQAWVAPYYWAAFVLSGDWR